MPRKENYIFLFGFLIDINVRIKSGAAWEGREYFCFFFVCVFDRLVL